MRAVVVANCQARPVSFFLNALNPSLNPIDVIVVHLRNSGHEDEDFAALAAADIIFAQFVSDQYHASHLSTSRLKETFGGKVISWPNIFFRGQTPDLAYVSIQRPSSARERLLGPLREYHHRGIIEAWQQSRSIEDAIRWLSSSSDSHSSRILSIARASLDELHRREASLDTKISDLIGAKWQSERLFFTFNHPSASLLETMARRLLERAGLAAKAEVPSAKEPLDLVIPPIFSRDQPVLGTAFREMPIKGAVFSMKDGKAENGAVKLYTLEDFVAASFEAYDAQLTKEDGLAYSPP